MLRLVEVDTYRIAMAKLMIGGYRKHVRTSLLIIIAIGSIFINFTMAGSILWWLNLSAYIDVYQLVNSHQGIRHH